MKYIVSSLCAKLTTPNMKQEILIFFTKPHHRRRIALAGMLCRLLPGLLWVTATPVAGAAEETVLLITGDQIPELAPVAETMPPAQRIDRYYALLDRAVAARADAALTDLGDLVSDYDVAFGAADTAEVNNVVSDIARRWAQLRTLHAQYYSPAAIADLEGAYRELFPLLDDDG